MHFYASQHATIRHDRPQFRRSNDPLQSNHSNWRQQLAHFESLRPRIFSTVMPILEPSLFRFHSHCLVSWELNKSVSTQKSYGNFWCSQPVLETFFFGSHRVATPKKPAAQNPQLGLGTCRPRSHPNPWETNLEPGKTKRFHHPMFFSLNHGLTMGFI